MNHVPRLHLTHDELDGYLIARPVGTLDSRTYGELRDQLIKLALEQPRAVLVDLADLQVVSETALTVFPAALNRVSEWPGVPIVLVVPDPARFKRLSASAVRRFVPIFPDVATAVASLPQQPVRRLVRAEFPPVLASLTPARELTLETCRAWGIRHRADDAVQLAAELTENAVRHAGADPFQLRLELRLGLLTVAVRDGSPRPAVLRHGAAGRPAGYGLHVVAEFSRVWGCAPTLDGGKVVWAVLTVGAEWLRSLRSWPVP